jgi:hypothetical protein
LIRVGFQESLCEIPLLVALLLSWRYSKADIETDHSDFQLRWMHRNTKIVDKVFRRLDGDGVGEWWTRNDASVPGLLASPIVPVAPGVCNAGRTFDTITA